MRNILGRVKAGIENIETAEKIYGAVKKVGIKYAYDATMKMKFKDACGYDLNLMNPQCFNEKIQWIKVNVHDPLMTKCADKVRVREYIEEKIGPKYLIDIYGIWKNSSEIDFSSLPNSFVLKTNHASGQVVIVNDKNKVDVNKVRAKIDKWLRSNYYYQTGEWVYKDIKPLVYCEKLLDKEIKDYKFYCFNGEPKFLYISQGLGICEKTAKMNFVDLNYKKTPWQRPSFLEFEKIPDKPVCFGEMIEVSRVLSKPFPFVRCDLYEVDGNVKFSELTFYPNGGFDPFYPLKWEKEIGGWLKLPYDGE